MISPVCNRNADILGADNTASFIQTPRVATAGEGAVNNRSHIGLGDTAPDSIQPAHVLGCRAGGLETSEKLARKLPAHAGGGDAILSSGVTAIVFVEVGRCGFAAPFEFISAPFHRVQL